MRIRDILVLAVLPSNIGPEILQLSVLGRIGADGLVTKHD